MISALIDVAHPSEPEAIDRLADTLAVLVPGVTAGLIGDAVILTPSPTSALETVAEGTGAALVVRSAGAPAWSAGARAARREWVLCLQAGDIPREGWIRILDRFTGTAASDLWLGRLRRSQAGLIERIASRAERVVGTSRPRAGDVVRRDRLLRATSMRIRPRVLPAWLEHA